MAPAKGLRPRDVMWRYAARNALLPQVASFGMALGFVVSGSLRSQGRTMGVGDGYVASAGSDHTDFTTTDGATYLSIFKI